MDRTTINLTVIHSQNLEKSKKFYETLGISFLYEQHGSGKKHLSAALEGIVFEIYPSSDDVDTSAVRLGFQVPSVDKAIEDLEKIGITVLSSPRDSQWGIRLMLASRLFMLQSTSQLKMLLEKKLTGFIRQQGKHQRLSVSNSQMITVLKMIWRTSVAGSKELLLFRKSNNEY